MACNFLAITLNHVTDPDIVHTVILVIIIFIFAFSAYATNVSLGSPGRVYDLLVEAGITHPVDVNAKGSYLTMRSKEGAIFFVINIVGNFGSEAQSSTYSSHNSLEDTHWSGRAEGNVRPDLADPVTCLTGNGYQKDC